MANGVVYVSSYDGNLYALNASTGAQLWSNPAPVFSSPAVANGVVYIATENGNMFALNASTGAQLWTYLAGDVSPVVVNGTLYVGSAAFN